MSDAQAALIVIAIIGHGLVILLQIFKSPKEVSSDMAKEVHSVRSDVKDIRADHHKLSREVSEIGGSMKSLKESIDGLREQVIALNRTIGANGGGRITRR